MKRSRWNSCWASPVWLWRLEELLLAGLLSSVYRETTGTEIKQESPVIWKLKCAALPWPVFKWSCPAAMWGAPLPLCPLPALGGESQTHSGAVVPWGTPHLCLIWRKAKELDGIPPAIPGDCSRESDLFLALAQLSLVRHPNTLEPLSDNEMGTAISC